MDEYAEWSHGRWADAAWELAGKVPVTAQYASALAWLFDSIKSSGGSAERDQYLELAKRWNVAEKTEKDEKVKRRLTHFERVRHGLFRRVTTYHTVKDHPGILAAEDVALRTVAYEVGWLSPEQINSAYQKDGPLAIEHLDKNLWIWREPKTRKALHDISWDADSRYNNNHMDCANAYNYHKEDLEKEHPDWFNEDESPEEVEPPDPNQQALTVGQFNELSYKYAVELMGEVLQVKKELQTTKRLTLILVIIVVVLVLMRLLR